MSSSSTGIGQLAEELKCSLCLDYFEDPVALKCQHNFCRECIKRVRSRAGELECPLCREKTLLTRPGGVNAIPRNFQLVGIIEGFHAVERERELLEEAQFDQQLGKQIEHIEQIDMHHQERQNAQSGQPPQAGYPSQYPSRNEHEPLSDDVFFPIGRAGHSTMSEGATIVSGNQDALPLQRGENISLQQHRERLRLLQQEQSKLQFKLHHQDLIDEFETQLQRREEEPNWRQQQLDRWQELKSPNHQEDDKKRAQSDLGPLLQHGRDVPPMEPLSWPLSQQDHYQHQPTQSMYPQSPKSFGGYPYPQQEDLPPISQPSSLKSQTSETSCGECQFPASAHCADCDRFFCWQCLQDLHNPNMGIYTGHRVTELTASVSGSDSGVFSPLSPTSGSTVYQKQEPFSALNTAMASLNVFQELTSMVTKEKTFKIPYNCKINSMGPGKNITIVGQPTEKCTRFHINFHCDRNFKKGDIALHFNPRFKPSKLVVRTSRIKNSYGYEERSAPVFPFAAGRPFKIEIICLIDKFEVCVDNQYFISYAHRIHDLNSIKVFLIAGDVKMSSLLGCD